MLYAAYDMWSRSASLVQYASAWWSRSAREGARLNENPVLLRLAAELEHIGVCRITHTRPDFDIHRVRDTEDKVWEIEQSVEISTPFSNLLSFKRIGATDSPKVLLVAPLSGHFSTLLAGTVKTLVQDHDVYLTDWLNPRDIPLEAGKFGFDEYVLHLIDFMRHLGSRVHLMGVCQPTVACLAAAALMAQDQDPCQPESIILLAGPIDTRYNPTKVNELALEKPIDWFKQHMIKKVPSSNPGAGRRVYPGFVQLLAFMSMNSQRHIQTLENMKTFRSQGEHGRADAIANFYREYFAVMDLHADFYLETVEKVFQTHQLPKRELIVAGRLVDCSALRKPFLLTIEGERDDICGIGQTLAAQDLCNKMPGYKKSHLLQPSVGHYGVFNGKRWEKRIYPVVRDFIQSCS